MQSNNQHKLNASMAKKTNITLVLKTHEQQNEKKQDANLNQVSVSTQTVFPSGWIKYRKSGYQGL